MYGLKALVDKLNGSRLTILSLLFGAVALAHLCLFIKYPFAPGYSIFTDLGEKLKFTLPTILLFTVFPVVNRNLDKVLSRFLINYIGLAFLAICVAYQIIGIPGQAWSTVAFSGLLILLLFNNLMEKCQLGQTVSFIFSFMTVWLGWVIFESIFQIGMWLHYPQYFQYTIEHLHSVMLIMALWMLPAIMYITLVLQDSKRRGLGLKLGNYKYFIILIITCAIATSIWFSNSMLIPIPIDVNGNVYPLEINYWTSDHLHFVISRLSQMSIMLASATLFFNRRKMEQ